MKIRDIQTTLLSVPLNPPIADATHVLHHIQWILVKVLTDEGLQGNSLMLTFDYGPELLRGIIDVELEKTFARQRPARHRRPLAGVFLALRIHRADGCCGLGHCGG